ncbi:MAG: hypothetical protein LIO65_09950, partial [Odoribacter sp.]|nr:hypothetical protein [Odoribacter sp.]
KRDYGNVNNAIDDLFQSGHNVRFGAEYRLNSVASLRGGYSFQNSPYKHDGSNFASYISGGDKIQTFSGGIGLNFGTFYCDAAYLHKKGKDSSVFYEYFDGNDYATSKPIKNQFINQEARLTLGVRF